MKPFNLKTSVKTLPLLLSGMLMAGQAQANSWTSCINILSASDYIAYGTDVNIANKGIRFALDGGENNGCTMSTFSGSPACIMFCQVGSFGHTEQTCRDAQKVALLAMVNNKKVKVFYDNSGQAKPYSFRIISYGGPNGECN